MGLHANGRLSPLGRQLLCEQIRVEGWTVETPLRGERQRAHRLRWLARYDAGEAMTDRSSRPAHEPEPDAGEV